MERRKTIYSVFFITAWGISPIPCIPAAENPAGRELKPDEETLSRERISSAAFNP
jgi:hypothetical protein